MTITAWTDSRLKTRIDTVSHLQRSGEYRFWQLHVKFFEKYQTWGKHFEYLSKIHFFIKGFQLLFETHIVHALKSEMLVSKRNDMPKAKKLDNFSTTLQKTHRWEKKFTHFRFSEINLHYDSYERLSWGKALWQLWTNILRKSTKPVLGVCN